MSAPRVPEATDVFDVRLRQFIYRHFIQKEKAPSTGEMAAALKRTPQEISAGLGRLSQSHAIMLDESGELWRGAARFAASPALPAARGRRPPAAHRPLAAPGGSRPPRHPGPGRCPPSP